MCTPVWAITWTVNRFGPRVSMSAEKSTTTSDSEHARQTSACWLWQALTVQLDRDLFLCRCPVVTWRTLRTFHVAISTTFQTVPHAGHFAGTLNFPSKPAPAQASRTYHSGILSTFSTAVPTPMACMAGNDPVAAAMTTTSPTSSKAFYGPKAMLITNMFRGKASVPPVTALARLSVAYQRAPSAWATPSFKSSTRIVNTIASKLLIAGPE